MSWYVMMCLTCASRTTGSACWSRMESSLSDGRIISGQLFTAFDEERNKKAQESWLPWRYSALVSLWAASLPLEVGRGPGWIHSIIWNRKKYGKICSNLAAKSDLGWTQGPSERYYGILTSKGEIKNDHSLRQQCDWNLDCLYRGAGSTLCIK